MKKLLVLSLVLALVLTLILPSVAMAAKPVPVNWSGSITGITDSFQPGTMVVPAGNSGKWRVVTRDIYGQFATGPMAGSDFTLNYKGVVDFPSQKGNVHGTLTSGDYEFEINGKSEGAFFYGFMPDDSAWGLLSGAPIYELAITGHWTCLKGDWRTGSFESSIKFVGSEDGHIYYVDSILSTFVMQNK